MPPPHEDDRAVDALRKLVNGYQASQAIHVAATLGIADLLAEGPRTSDDLAAETGAHPDALYRLLRALAGVGIFREEEDRRFALTDLGAPLRSDAPDSIADWARFVGRRYYRDAWSSLLDSVRTGENAFRLTHGVGVWEYRAMRPEESEIFDRAMAANSRRDIQAVLAAFDLSRFQTLADVGGGNGALLRAALERYEHLRGILFDQPHVVAGVDLGDRCHVVAGDFFEEVPGGADAYLLKSILHDWEDEESIAILRNVRRAGGVLLVVERVVGPPNEGPEAKLSDLNMLVAPGGRERTEAEYAALFEAGGFRLVGVTPTESGADVLEGAPA
ncbi:MAG TPA: methyltransferase [Gaiellaceae bacterium]|nr:methyltransferase [Gaiellaceae bacterium]